MPVAVKCVIATHAFYAPFSQADLPFTANDDYSAVVHAFGQPASERLNPPYELLAYPRKKLYVILMAQDHGAIEPGRGNARYIGAMDWTWHPAHAVDLAGYGSSYPLLRRLPKF